MFEILTALYIKDFFNEREREGDEERQSDLQRALFDVTVDIEVTTMDPPFMEKDDGGGGVEDGGNAKKNGGGGSSSRAVDDDADSDGSNDDRIRTLLLRTTPRRQEERFRSSSSRRRKLEGKVTITYSQIISYRVQNNAEVDLLDLKSIVKEPFNNVLKRDKYVASLKDGGEGRFDALKLATLPMIQGPDLVVKQSINKLFVGLVVGGFVCFAMLGTMCRKTRKFNIRLSEYVLPDITDTDTLNTNPNAGFVSEAEMASLPEQARSVATIDHDYIPSHRPCSASTAGGTLGTLETLGTLGTHKSSKTGSQSASTNDESFIEYFSGRKKCNRVKDVYYVIVPPGKVGVVFNTPDSGAPTIDSFREYCLISDQLAIGDQIIAVDDENVEEMTAVQLQKLYNQKSGNLTRQFTMLRKS